MKSYLTKFMVLCAAVALYKLTGSALFSAALPCISGGWRSIRCGWWLLHADAVVSRRRTCFCFYLATACWKAAFFSVVTWLACIMIRDRVLPLGPQLEALLMVFPVAICLSGLIGLIGMTTARAGKVRVWTNSHLRERCGGDLRRVGKLGYLGFNDAGIVGITVLVFPFEIGFLARQWAPIGPLLPVVLLCGGLLGAILLFGLLSLGTIANSAAECWPASVQQPEV
jgi:hypothetical protein